MERYVAKVLSNLSALIVGMVGFAGAGLVRRVR